MAEKEQDYRHGDGSTRREIQGKLLTRGQIFAFVLSLAIVIGGIMLIMMDKPTSGFIAILSGIAVVAGPFFYARRFRKKQTD